jgi:alkanesulfonate monooxygenase SsuD/methylene tetrahydromethanopterin reductase-like flavin-dependent oxidoreductase (luciferase family)
MVERNPGLLGGNKLKLGLFGANCSGGLAFTKLPERWNGSWQGNERLAVLADHVGFECMVPIARWSGFGGASNVNSKSWETLTWATGLLAKTSRVTVFGTVHVPMVHPVFAAKQMVTADHIGRGRFGLNIVCGWNKSEFDMFGVEALAHDLRYKYGEDWFNVVKSVWAAKEPQDYTSEFFDLKKLTGEPAPYGGIAPITMSAGASETGRDFAIRNVDLHFDYCRTPEESHSRIAETKALAQAAGRNINVWIPASVVCRETRELAQQYAMHCVDNADWEALDEQYRLYTGAFGSKTRSSAETEYVRHQQQVRAVLGYGGSYSLCGSPDDVAEQLAQLSNAGFDGVAISFVNYLEEMPFFVQEVLPRLARKGLRSR